MPDQLFIYYIEIALMIISINSGSWGRVMVIRLVVNFGELVKVALKKGGKKGWMGKRYGGSWGLWPLFVFECISFVVVDGACVKDCRGLGLCTVGAVG
jgi:hypothetical protein